MRLDVPGSRCRLVPVSGSRSLNACVAYCDKHEALVPIGVDPDRLRDTIKSSRTNKAQQRMHGLRSRATRSHHLGPDASNGTSVRHTTHKDLVIHQTIMADRPTPVDSSRNPTEIRSPHRAETPRVDITSAGADTRGSMCQ